MGDAEAFDDVFVDIFRISGGIDYGDESLCVVVIDDWGGALGEHSESLSDGVWLVVLSDDERSITFIAESFSFWRFIDGVVDFAAFGASQSAIESFDDDIWFDD